MSTVGAVVSDQADGEVPSPLAEDSREQVPEQLGANSSAKADAAATPIEDAQRNGTLTGLAVVLGFSLAFTANWTQGSDAWIKRGAVVFGVASLGIAVQVWSLFRVLKLRPGMLDEKPRPISVAAHGSAVRWFACGVVVVLLAYAYQFGADIYRDLTQSRS
jgi:hypothetical protein